MGVLNVTPDSFSDGGCYLEPSRAVDHVQLMVEEGADLIDIGAESTRPGAGVVNEQEEIKRLKPVLQALGHRTHIPLSIDTRNASVAKLALDYGVAIVNDVSALRFDPLMGRVVAESKAGLVLMHMQEDPQSMQRAPVYTDVIKEIKTFFKERISTAQEYGIPTEKILLDPGIGFGKNLNHNLTILNGLHHFLNLGNPLMIGVSKKSFIGQVLNKSIAERLMGTAAAVAVAVMRGAQVIRVHEVGLMQDVVRMTKALKDCQCHEEIMEAK